MKNKMSFKRNICLLIIIILLIYPFNSVAAGEVLDYRDVRLYYSSTYVQIKKPTAALTVSAGGSSGSDGEYIHAVQNDVAYFSTEGCDPGSAGCIDGWDFQFSSPNGYYVLPYVPSSIVLDTPGIWTFYLCVKGDIPDSEILQHYSDWSDNGSHSVLGRFNMLWHFVAVTVEVQPLVSHSGSINASVFAYSLTPYLLIDANTFNNKSASVFLDASSSSAEYDGETTVIDSYEFWCGSTRDFTSEPILSTSSSSANIQIDLPISPSFYGNSIKLYAKAKVRSSTLHGAGIEPYVSEAVTEFHVPVRYRPEANIVAPLIALAGSTFAVSSAGSYSPDPACHIASYVWSVEQPSSSTLNSETAQGFVRFDTPGLYNISLTVIDNLGEVSYPATHTVEVLPYEPGSSGNRNPVAIITGAYTTQPGSYIELDGTSSYDPDGSIVSYSWQSPNAVLTPSGATCSVYCHSAGLYDVSLTVTDNEGAVSTAYHTIFSENPVPFENSPPVAIAEIPDEVYVGEMFSICGSSSYDPDPNDYIVSYVWESDYTEQIAAEADAQYSYASPGNHTIILTVRDSFGAEGYSIKTISVIPPEGGGGSNPEPEYKYTLNIVPNEKNWTNKPVNVQITADSYSVTSIHYGVSTALPAGLNNVNNKYYVHTAISNEGIWYISAYGADNNGDRSALVTAGPYKLDLTLPQLQAYPDTKNECYAYPFKVTLQASDSGGSGLKSIGIRWSMTPDRPYNWTVYYDNIAETTLYQEGIYYLHALARDNAGNETYKCYGPYIVTKDGTLPSPDGSVDIQGTWNYHEGSSHHFMSLELVRIHVCTSGYADKVVIRFSPQLEKMSFTDNDGYYYEYKEFTGYEINFPEDSTCLLNPEYEFSDVFWDYFIPLAPSTVSTDGMRLRSPYKMEVEIWKGSVVKQLVIDDIDITGNIYDHIHIQPV